MARNLEHIEWVKHQSRHWGINVSWKRMCICNNHDVNAHVLRYYGKDYSKGKPRQQIASFFQGHHDIPGLYCSSLHLIEKWGLYINENLYSIEWYKCIKKISPFLLFPHTFYSSDLLSIY